MTLARERADIGGLPAGIATGAPTSSERVRDYLKALRRRWLLFAALTFLAVAVALAASLSMTKKYDATAQVVLERTDPVSERLDPGGGTSNDPERDINTGVALIKLDDVATAVKRRLQLPTPVPDLQDQVTTELVGTSDLVSITARDESPRRAAAIANAFAEEYVDFRRRTARQRFEDAARLARQRLAELSEDERASAEGRQLAAYLRELEISSALQTGGARVAELAKPPTAPASPRPLLNAILAGFLGAFIAGAIAIGLEFADRRLKDEDDVESAFGLPILASIPRPRRVGRGKGPQPHDEAYTTLATNLRFLGIGGTDLRSVMISSAGPSEGKTTTTLGLARGLAMLRRRVIAIEADLRRPAFAEYLDLGDTGGLSMVLAGLSDLNSQIVEFDASTGERVTDAAPGPDTLTFSVLAAGRVVPHPHRVLSSAKMREVITEAADLADFVLIDTPPVDTVSDAVSLANLVDAALVIVRLNQSKRDGVRRALRAFQNIGVDVPGVILTGATARGSGAYGYYAIEPDGNNRGRRLGRRRTAKR